MIYAFWRMVTGKTGQRNYSSRYYEIAKKKFIEVQTLNLPVNKIIELYKNGRSTVEIAEKFDCSCDPITRILKRNNIKIKSSGEILALKLPVNKIIELYKNGRSTVEIAEKFKCSDCTIGKLLKNNNIKIRSASEANLGFDINDFKDEIIELYKNGLTTIEIAEKFKCSHSTIGKLLKKNNVKLRTIGEIKLGKSKLDNFKDEIIKLYKSGQSTIKIAKKFNCTDSTIGNFLKKNNVKIRSMNNK